MIVYHFTIPATDTADSRSFYFLRKAEAVADCKKEAACMVKDDKALSGYAVEIRRSSLVALPKKELMLRLLNQRGFLRDTVVVGEVHAPSVRGLT